VGRVILMDGVGQALLGVGVVREMLCLLKALRVVEAKGFQRAVEARGDLRLVLVSHRFIPMQWVGSLPRWI
jgi:hypothetical protein